MTAVKEMDKWEVEETEESEIEEQDEIPYTISYYPADFTLKGYLDKWDSGQLLIPSFQRSYVWDQVKASKLIESFLLGLPVPGVFLYKERETNKLKVIDGQQRIHSVIRFFKNQFDERIFRLKKVQAKWEGRTFEDLSEADRLLLEDTVLRATVVQQLDPDDDSSIYHIFERLNTGGINLNPMEIRKCVFSGDFFDLLDELNKYKPWRKILGKPTLDKRLRDVELVLRVLALTDGWRNYEKPMKGFLNEYMAVANRLPKDELGKFLSKRHKQFKRACDSVLAELGEKPFHLHRRLNYAVMDSTMAIAAKALNHGLDKFKDRYDSLLEDPAYIDCATKNTSDEKTLKLRFERARDILLGTS